MSIDLRTDTASISLCNIYAPNDLPQQLGFLHNLNTFLVSNTDTGSLIIGGDWNVTLEAVDKKGGVPWKPFGLSAVGNLQEMMASRGSFITTSLIC